MSTILGSDGRPATDPTEPAPPTNGHNKTPDKSEVQDVRTVPTGVLFYNLVLCGNGMQTNKMILDQIQHEMAQQKVIIDPPQVQQLKEVLAHQLNARNVMVGELNFRFADIDARRIANLGIEAQDLRAPDMSEVGK